MLGLASDRYQAIGDFPNCHRKSVQFDGTPDDWIPDNAAGVESAAAAAAVAAVVVDSVFDVVGCHWDGQSQERIGGEPAIAGVRTEVTVWK